MINFALYLNETSLLLEDALTQLQYNAEELDFNFFLFAEQRKFDNWFPVHKNSIKLDGILVLGGDGTILRAVKYSLKYKSPLLGINLGHLGFLTETTLFELKKSLNYIKEKRYKILSRMMLKVNVKKKHGSQSTHLALNDVVLSKGESPKLINLKFYNNRRYVFSTRCDGMIVASPTGSTAYSLSAGGPIISPVMDALVVVPITPHVLTVRPMVFPSSDIITILIEGQNENCCLQIDGCNYENLSQEDKLQISSANEKVDFIKLSNRTFYKILRQKMHLGKR